MKEFLGPKIERLKHVWFAEGTRGLIRFLYRRTISKVFRIRNYQEWVYKNRLTPQDIADRQSQIAQWQYHPKFSVIMPVYNVDPKWLEKAIASVVNQIYPEWELCIADDASTNPAIRKLLTRYSKLDPRIKVIFRPQNGQISAASNSALEIATGDYIALLDHDDELSIDALYENARLINQHPDADFIYSDEDKIDVRGRRSTPFFKPDWSPDYFHACMYTCHLGVYRTRLVREMGGFRSEYDGAQDYDLVLRIVEKTRNIYHIPRILYHWRSLPTSVASSDRAKPWAYDAARRALEDMLRRSPYPGRVDPGPVTGFFRVRRDILNEPLISIVIPSAGKMVDTPKGPICLLEQSIRSIQTLTTYSNFEIVLVDGYDVPDPILEAIAAPNLRLIRSAEPFNFSMRMNLGVAASKGEVLLLLNDDIEVLNPDWLESMLELAQQKEIGAVGAKLLYPNGKLQHAGVVILEGRPGHAFYNYGASHAGYYYSNLVNRNYLAVTGACTMMRAEVFHHIGKFDEEFPMNFNDVDLCLKAHQAGYRNLVTPYVTLIHHESATRQTGLRPGEFERLMNKWQAYLHQINADPYYNPNFSQDAPNFELKYY